MDDILKEFLVEAYELLERIDQDLLSLEKDTQSRPLWDSILRNLHTIKGTCGFLGMSRLEKASHRTESFMIRFRDGELSYSSESTSVFLNLVDICKKLLTRVEAVGSDDDDVLVDELLQIIDDGSGQSLCNGKAPAEIPIERPNNEGRGADVPQETISVAASTPVEKSGEAHVEPPTSIAAQLTNASPPPKADDAPPREQAKTSTISDTKIRVDVHHLDCLMNLVGELVLTRNRVLQCASNSDNTAFIASTQRLNQITTELQEAVMKTRMQPIDTVWSKFPRVVRDLARQCGKLINLTMEGKETELDKTILEAIKDPLTHIVRNSIDHGIEDPVTRELSAKAAEGSLTLRACHQSGFVLIEIIDDGKGIDANALKKKALEKSLISQSRAETMSEREALELIFMPGLSTAKAVTNISGRGVGMDVVRSNIELIGGAVEIESAPGSGTTLRLKIPLTLAIVPALIVESGNQRFAVPQASLLELVGIDAGESSIGIEFIHNAPVLRLRGRLIPLLWLNEQLRLPLSEERKSQDAIIAIVQAEERRFGIVVDRVKDTQEIVVKPLSRQLSSLHVYAGATIMGDGYVALILDVNALAKASGMVLDRAHISDSANDDDKANTLAEKRSILLCRYGSNTRVGIPLSSVSRLEKLTTEAAELTACGEVVQYRGGIMPILRLKEMFADPTLPSSPGNRGDTLDVVVLSAANGKAVGVVVDEIVDIVTEYVSAEESSNKPEVESIAVVAGQVTELLNMDVIAQRAFAGIRVQ